MKRGGNTFNRTLIQLHDAFVASRSEDSRRSCAKMDRAHAAKVRALAARGITTMPALVDALPHLPSALCDFGVWWISVRRFRGAESVLLKLLHDDHRRRLACAAALSSIGGRKSEREFIRIAKVQLATESPDCEWLDAVIQGLRFPDSPEAEEILLSIFESNVLPGWLRGNAGDAMSSCSQLNDHRLAPGFWWPMSAEADDAVCVIETGSWPELDAGDRWHGNPARGEMRHF